MRFDPRQRLRWLALGAGALVVAAGLAVAHGARSRRSEPVRAEAAHAAVLWLGVPDLSLSSSSRWLRHPSQVEPAAAAADLPAGLDVDPAGAIVAPPTAIFDASARGLAPVPGPPGAP